MPAQDSPQTLPERLSAPGSFQNSQTQTSARTPTVPQPLHGPRATRPAPNPPNLSRQSSQTHTAARTSHISTLLARVVGHARLADLPRLRPQTSPEPLAGPGTFPQTPPPPPSPSDPLEPFPHLDRPRARAPPYRPSQILVVGSTPLQSVSQPPGSFQNSHLLGSPTVPHPFARVLGHARPADQILGCCRLQSACQRLGPTHLFGPPTVPQ